MPELGWAPGLAWVTELGLVREPGWVLGWAWVPELGRVLEPGRVTGLSWVLERRCGRGLGPGLLPPAHASHRRPGPRRWLPTPLPRTRPGRRTRPERRPGRARRPGLPLRSGQSPPLQLLRDWTDGRTDRQRDGQRDRTDRRTDRTNCQLGHVLPPPPTPGTPRLPAPLTQLGVPDAHVALQQVVHPARCRHLRVVGLWTGEWPGERRAGPGLINLWWLLGGKGCRTHAPKD